MAHRNSVTNPREAPRPAQNEEMREGHITYKIASHTANSERQHPGASDDEVSQARYAFDREKQFEESSDQRGPITRFLLRVKLRLEKPTNQGKGNV